MLLAEDLLLLLTDDTTGKSLVDHTRLDLALAGAVLLELALRGRADVAGPGEAVKAGRVVVRDPAPTDDAVLDEGLRRIAVAGHKKPQAVLPSIQKGLRPELFKRLVGRGILRFEEGRVLGIFPTTAWPAVDSTHEVQLRRGLYDVLVVGRAPTSDEAAVISLLHAIDALPKALPATGVPTRELRRRAKAVAGDEWAGAGVRKAVEAVTAATTAAVMAATTAATVSS